MGQPLFGTLSQLARFRGVDVRNRLLRDLPPAAYLVAGGKRFALFELPDGTQVATKSTSIKTKE
jgi:hypothetical protein